jgi:hypothetical protein
MAKMHAVVKAAVFSGVVAVVVMASTGVAYATPSVDVSSSATTNGVMSVARTGTVDVSGTAENTNPPAGPACVTRPSPTTCSQVRLTSNWHVSEGVIVAFDTSQGTCAQLDPATVRCNTGVLNRPGQSVSSDITVRPTSDPTKHHVEITFAAGPRVTDQNWSNNVVMLTLKLVG